MTESEQGQHQSGTEQSLPHKVTGGVAAAVDATASLAEEVIHAAGRVGTTALDEIFGLLGTVAGGISETASAVFQGRRHSRRTESHDTDSRRAS